MDRRGFLKGLLGLAAATGLPRVAEAPGYGDLTLGVDVAYEGLDRAVVTFYGLDGKVLGGPLFIELEQAQKAIAEAFLLRPEIALAKTTPGRTLVDGFHQLSIGYTRGNEGGGGELVDGSMTEDVRDGWWKSSTRRPPVRLKLLKNKGFYHGIHPPTFHQASRRPYAEASRTVRPPLGGLPPSLRQGAARGWRRYGR